MMHLLVETAQTDEHDWAKVVRASWYPWIHPTPATTLWLPTMILIICFILPAQA
jgi:hypothetical protein